MQEYPFRVSALAKQSVIPNQSNVYPFRDIASAKEPALIEDTGDVAELIVIVALLGAICVAFLFVVEMMYPGWSVATLGKVKG